MITVENRYRYDGEGVNIMRPSLLGNPYRVSDYGRGNTIELYREWLRREWVKNGEVRRELERLVELAKRGDLVLVCCCKPKPCHGDVIKDAI